MSWMRVSQLPVMAAFRDIKDVKPIRLWGSKPSRPRRVGRQLGSAKKVAALLARLTRERRIA